MTTTTAPSTYHPLLKILHWVMALSFFAMLVSGLGVDELVQDKALKFQIIQWHKSLGVLLLWLIGLRVALRLATRKPAWPQALPARDITLARLGHLALYAVMIALPFSGWVMVSSSSYGLPTIVFGWFEWPHIQAVLQNEAINHNAKEAHEILAFGLIGLLIVHIGAVIKHRVFEKIDLLPRITFRKNVSALLMGLGLWVATGGLETASAAPLTLDTAQSTLTFKGQHAGDDFSGVFTKWTADIDFDENALDRSHATIRIDTSSAKTGNAMYDGTLPTADWLNSSEHAQAVFTSQTFTKNTDGTYQVEGTLTLKGVSQTIRFPFNLKTEQDGRKQVSFTTSLNRLAYNIGTKSDSTGEWVSPEITVTAKLTAR